VCLNCILFDDLLFLHCKTCAIDCHWFIKGYLLTYLQNDRWELALNIIIRIKHNAQWSVTVRVKWQIRETPASCGTDANCHCPRMVNSKRQADQYASAVSLLYLACRLVDFKAFSTANWFNTHTHTPTVVCVVILLEIDEFYQQLVPLNFLLQLLNNFFLSLYLDG